VDYSHLLREHLAAEVECEVVSLPGLGFSGFLTLRRLARNHDVLHVQMPCYGWRYSILPALVPWALPKRVLLAATFHEWKQMHPIRRKLLGALCARASGVIFVSAHVRGQFQAECCKKKSRFEVATIPIGVNVPFHAPNPIAARSMRERLTGNAPGARLLTQFGTIYESKQPDRLLAAIARLRDQGVDVRLALVGSFIKTAEFREAEFKARIDRLGLGDRIAWLGPIADEAELACVMAASDAVVELYADGLSMRRGSFWYAAQFGVPILTTVPAEENEFAARPDVLAYEGLRLIPIRSTVQEVADAILALPDYRFRPFKPLVAPSWHDIAIEHIRLYNSLAPTQGPGS
jgi:glycosyltransferase involved in cell wall biosynthesis